jgi:hypothetical protein
MEVVGVDASVVTLTQLVIEGVKLAKTLYTAPDDLAALQVSGADPHSALPVVMGWQLENTTSVGHKKFPIAQR